jgi:hypothetical protein
VFAISTLETDGNNDPISAAIDAAEEICDPLEGLAEKTIADPGAAFAPEVLERLATLKKDDRAAFEALRAKLKKAGCRITALDEAIAEESGEAGGRGPTQADILIDLAQTAELFHAPDSTGFADLDINGHRETWPIRSCSKAIKGQRAKQPYAIAMRWRPIRHRLHLGELEGASVGRLDSHVRIITTDANELVAEIHDRMPLILAPGEPDPRDLMRPFPAAPMRMWPISTRVNKPENDDPSILDPVELVMDAA